MVARPGAIAVDPWMADGHPPSGVFAASLVLDQLATGVAILGRRLEIEYANRVACDLLDREGAAIGRLKDRLVVKVPDLAQDLQSAVRQIQDGLPCRRPALLVPAAGGAPTIALRLKAIETADPRSFASDGGRPPVVLLMRAADREPDLDAVHGLFGLTRAETRVAGGLMRGRSIAEIAGDLGISINTARTHVARIFTKTDTRQQGPLVALLKTFDMP